MLKEITLACYVQGHPNQFINSHTWFVSELYCSFLKHYNANKVVKCNIDIKDDWGAYSENYVKHTNVITIKLNFDFEKYLLLPKLEMKKMLLNILHKGMMMIAENDRWEIDKLLDAYNNCLKQNLEYNFFVKNGKLLSSPNRKYKVGLWCEWDIDKFEVYYILFGKDSIEIKRNLFINCIPSFGEFIYYTHWKWINNETLLVESKYKYGNNEKWTINVFE